MQSFTKEIVATGADTFEIRLVKPFGLVLETLAGPENRSSSLASPTRNSMPTRR
jgi:hypothetical protein